MAPGDLLPPGFWEGWAYDINDNDVVVGYVRDSSAIRAARWLSLTEIMLLPSLPGTRDCKATDVNEHGTILGFCYLTGGQTRVVLWPTRGGVMDLGRGDPAGINNRGDVAWTDVGLWPNTEFSAFVRDKHGEVENIFAGVFAKAFGLNNRGMVSGSRSVPGGTYEVFIWTRPKGLEVIELPADVSIYATDIAVNDAGHLAGIHQRRTADPTSPGCIGVWFWSTDAGFREVECTQSGLGLTPRGVKDINNEDVIAGWVGGANYWQQTAVLWRPGAGRIAEYSQPLGGAAEAVNGSGRAVGYAIVGDPNVRLNPHPFVF